MSSSDTPFQDSDPSEFERSLRRTLQARAPGGAPPEALRIAIPSIATERIGVTRRIRIGLGSTQVGHRRSRLAPFATFGLALAVVTIVGAFGLAMTRTSGVSSGPSAAAVSWHDGAVTLTADSVTIDVGGHTFEAPEGSVRVHSDPGDATYRTLEMEWNVGEREMRLYLYFKADHVNWWASEIRTYDGQPTPDWVYYRGPLLKTPIGQTFRGDLDIKSSDGTVPGHLVIRGMRLSAFQPGDGPITLQHCRPVGPTAAPDGSEPDPMASGQPLADARLGSMSPKEIAQLLEVKGYCYTFRLLTAGFSQIWCVPPGGSVSGFGYGSSGELIVFVRADPRTFDPNTPTRVGC